MNRNEKSYWLYLVVLACSLLPATRPVAAQTPGPDKPAPSAVADAYYHFTLGRLYDAAGDSAGALSEYQAALKSDPDNAQLLAEYGSVLADAGRTEEALQTAQKAVEKDPANVDAHLLVGDIHSRVRLRQDPKARDLAIGEYETVLKLDPDNTAALGSLGRLYVAGSQYAQAEEVLQRLVNRQPNAIEELFLLALSQAEQQKFDTALANSKEVLRHNPSNARVLALQGFIYERTRDIDSAIRIYREILKIQPQDAEAKRRLASLLVEKGEAGDAVEILEELARRNPFDSSVLLELGRIQREQKKYPEAIAGFRSAAKADPDNTEVSYWLAVTLADTAQREEAISILKKLLDTKSEERSQQRSRFPLLVQLGTIQQDDAQYDAAIATFGQLVRDFPEDFRSYLYLANAYRLKKNWTKAAETIARGREKFPDESALLITEAQVISQLRTLQEGLQLLDTEIRRHAAAGRPQDKAALLPLELSRTQLYFDRRAFQQAEGELLKLNSEHPDNEMILFQLGAVYERQRKFAEAEEVFKGLLEKNADNAGVLNYLGYMWADRGENLEQALEYIQRAVDLDPYNGAYLDSLGWAQFKLNEYKAAEINLNKAARIVRNDATIHQHLGDLHEKLGNYEEALQAYRLSLTYASEDTDSDRIKEKIRELNKLTKK
ncbi:MAG: tetratricopeptide repeat protein [Acidobacteria bacterium]|nr:tetratricopeptide repeat protein [Acidobacteriota bacterium]